METIKEKEKEKEQKLVLTPSQQRAFDQFKEFLEDDTKVFILKGYAGTGKTTLVKTFVEELRKRKETYKLLASTGRAAKIMRDRTGEDARTIHSTIYKFTDLNLDLDEVFKDVNEPPKMDNTGQLLLNFTFSAVENSDYKRCFYIVDEASMIGDMNNPSPSQAIYGSGKLLTDLLHFDLKGKYIFVGDYFQLPPVQEKESPALSSNYIANELGYKCKQAEISEIMRQPGQSDIAISSLKIREMGAQCRLKQAIRDPLLPLEGYGDIIMTQDTEDLVKRYIDDIRENGYDESTLVTRFNKECYDFSIYIRKALHKNNIIDIGDLLLVTQNNYISGLANGDMVTITQILSGHQQAGLTFQMVEVEELVTKQKYTQFLILNTLCGAGPNITPDQHKELLFDFFFRMKQQGIKQKSELFKEKMLSDPYLNALRANYGYAVTCNKAQGGEWERAYINIPKRYSLYTYKEDLQWLYTAVTRAKNKLFIVDEFKFAQRIN